MSYLTRIKENLLYASREKDNFSKALKEWFYKYSYDTREESVSSEETFCELCGHEHIVEICIIENLHNSNQLRIGNKCVQFFTGEIGEKHKKAINGVRAKRKRVSFEKTPVGRIFCYLGEILPPKGVRREKYDKILNRVETNGCPTKKQCEALESIYETYVPERYQRLIKTGLTGWDKDFIFKLAKFRKDPQELSLKQLVQLERIEALFDT